MKWKVSRQAMVRRNLEMGRVMGLLSGGSDYIGLGTMMQDATDYLGERQQEDYRRWKAKVMARVQEVEAT
jgi:origin recognition complex subunit 6